MKKFSRENINELKNRIKQESVAILKRRSEYAVIV